MLEEKAVDDTTIHVLLIEDNPTDARMVRGFLREAKGRRFELHTANSLRAGLDVLDQYTFDAVLLDLVLPDSQGLATLNAVRNAAAGKPLLVLTGLDDDETGVAAVAAGAQDYLVKGDVSRSVLARAVQYAIARSRLERRLAEQSSQLQAANQLKDLFTEILRHDLLNAVSVIHGMAGMMNDFPHSEGEQAMLTAIFRNAEKVVEIIRSASLYSKLENPGELERKRMDVGSLLRNACEQLRPLVAEREQHLEYVCDEPCYMLVNPMIENVFANLISNASKYSEPGEGIEVGIANDEASCTVWVKDRGPGIPPADRTTLFTRFHRLNQESVKGTGLGLAIVKRIVDLHAGRVWIEDNPAGGSIFYVSIPKGPSWGQEQIDSSPEAPPENPSAVCS
jgi:signal transduction histidine kinase